MYRVGNRGVRVVVLLVAVILVVVVGTAIGLGEMSGTNSQVDERFGAVESAEIGERTVTENSLSDPGGLANDWDVEVSDLEGADGVNLTAPDQTFSAEPAPESHYSVTFLSGETVTPHEGLDETVLEIDYVFDEFSPDVHPDDIVDVVTEDLIEDGDVVEVEDGLIGDNVLLDDVLIDDEVFEEVVFEEGVIDESLLLEADAIDEDVLVTDGGLDVIDMGTESDDETESDDSSNEFDAFDTAVDANQSVDTNLTVDTELTVDTNLTVDADRTTDDSVEEDTSHIDELVEVDGAHYLNQTIDFELVGNLSISDDVSLDNLQTELGVERVDVPVMVQFEDAFDPDYIDTVERLDYRLTDDLTDHTQYGLVPADTVDDLEALPFVRSVTDVDPGTKLSPAVDTERTNRQPVVVSTFGDLSADSLDLERVATDTAEQPAPSPEELAVRGIDSRTAEFQAGEPGAMYVGELTGAEILELSESTVVRFIDAFEETEEHVREPPQTTGGVEHTDLLSGVDNWDGSDTTVGILDSGIESDHPHFDESDVTLSYDWTADLLPYTDGDSGEDNDGHGTHVAGIVTGDGEGQSGVAPETSLIVSRVLDDPDSVPEQAANPQTWFSDEAMWVGPLVNPPRIFDYVVESGSAEGNHVDVMSNSWGYDWGSYDYLLTGPVDGWANDNPFTLQITSNGNAEDTSTWPAAGKNVLAVGGLTSGHSLSWLNDISPPEDGQVKPDVNAPACITSADVGHEYDTKCGTSMATPYVSGLAARYIGHEKADRNIDKIRANEVKTALIASTTGQLNPNEYEGVGWGAINDLKLHNLATTPGNQLTSVVADNDVNAHSFDVPEDAGHVEVTLSWSEKQNRLTTSFLRNDLHLYLTNGNPDDVIEIDSNWIGSDDVTIDVDEPLQVDNSEDRTVRRASIPADELEAGEWHVLVHADDTTWDSNTVLYDVAIDLQGDDGFRVDGTAFEAPQGEETEVRLELDGGHPGDDAARMIPEITTGVQLEDLDVEGGDLCGWELIRGATVLETGDAGDTTAPVGTLTGADTKYLDVCVEVDQQPGTLVGIEYEFSYVEYPADRVSTRTATSETGSRETVSGLLGGVSREGDGTDDDADDGYGGGGPGFSLPIVAGALGTAVLLSHLRRDTAIESET